MEKLTLLRIVFLLSNAVHYSSCERFKIIPTADSPCPEEFTGEPCLTLQQYVANPSLSSNITLDLHSGNHHLDSLFSVANINSFTMRANATATVNCSQQLQIYSYEWFTFDRIQQFYVSGVTFIGCRMTLRSVTNATFVRTSLVNRITRCCYYGAVLYISSTSQLLIKQCNITNNKGYNGAIYMVGGLSSLKVVRSIFANNSYPYPLSHVYSGGAIFVRNGKKMNIIDSTFMNNQATGGEKGGAVYWDGGNITIINTTFINNTAIDAGGGALHSVRRYTNITLVNNTFSYNTAIYCGVIDIDEFFHNDINFTGNTFTYNRAVGLVAGNNGGGVICIRNASISLVDNNFSHNTATGNAGVIRVDESHVTIQRSIFSNNTAGGDGGVFHTYFYPTTYTISHTSFTDNQAGGDGGVMYVGRAGSYVTISQSTFTSNSATNRGGVLAVIGTTVHINGATISDNTAQLGEVVSACNSNVTFSDPQISSTQDPVYSFCSLYNSSNRTVSMTTQQAPSTTDTTTNPLTETVTTTQQDSTTTLSTPDEATSNQPTAITTTQSTTATTTKEQTTTPTFTTTEDSGVDTTTAVMEDITTSETTNGTTTSVTMTTKEADNDVTKATTVLEDTITTAAPASTETTTSSGYSTDGVTDTTVTSPEATTQGEVTTNNVDITAEPSTSDSTTTSDVIVTKAMNDTMIAMTTTPSQDGTTDEANTTHYTTVEDNFIPTTIKIATDDDEQESIQLDIHQIRIPGYIALAVSAVLLVLVIVFGAAIIIKVHRARPKQPQTELTHFNFSENGCPAIENGYTLSDVQVDSTTVKEELKL